MFFCSFVFTLQGSNCLLRSEWQTAYLSSWRNGRISKARIEILRCTQNDKPRTCHPIFALSLTRFAFRNPNGITCGYAAFDLLLQNSSITKRCFVIPTERSDEESPFQHISPFYFEFSPDVEMTMFQCATIGRIALNIVYNPFTKVHYTYAGGKSANSIRKFPVIL